MNNTATNNETNNIQSFMNFPCYESVSCIPVTMQELKVVQPLMAKEWDVLDVCEEQIDYFYTCVTNVRNEAKRKANTHETKFYVTHGSGCEKRFHTTTFQERFVNTRNGIELEFNFRGENESMNIRIPQNRLEEMYKVSQTK
tara:strand:+ start:326 stop:751 length:426 start_codon:yes stop_codon:yes gene_type:complete